MTTSMIGVTHTMTRLWSWYFSYFHLVALLCSDSLRTALLIIKFTADGHSKKSRNSQPVFNQNLGGSFKPLLCNHWRECLYEDWCRVLEPSWWWVDTGNQWPELCSLAEVMIYEVLQYPYIRAYLCMRKKKDNEIIQVFFEIAMGTVFRSRSCFSVD